MFVNYKHKAYWVVFARIFTESNEVMSNRFENRTVPFDRREILVIRSIRSTAIPAAKIAILLITLKNVSFAKYSRW